MNPNKPQLSEISLALLNTPKGKQIPNADFKFLTERIALSIETGIRKVNPDLSEEAIIKQVEKGKKEACLWNIATEGYCGA